jgi:hypothetical protein
MHHLAYAVDRPVTNHDLATGIALAGLIDLAAGQIGWLDPGAHRPFSWSMPQGFRFKQAGWWYRLARISAVPKIR